MLTFSTETISPADAQKYLATSPYNRVTKTSMSVVRQYAEAMKRGEWVYDNGDCIVFDEDNNLFQGHHRMHAVILAGIPVKFTVCRGAARSSFTTCNCGVRTNLGQILAMKDVQNAKTIMSIMNVEHNLAEYGRFRQVGGDSAYHHTVTEDYNTYLADSAGYDSAAALVNKLVKVKILRGSWIGAMYYYLTHRGGYSEDFVSTFLENVCSLQTSNIPPCEKLRSLLLSRRLSNMKFEEGYESAVLIKAWNAYATGKVLRKLRYDPEIEEYPKFKLAF